MHLRFLFSLILLSSLSPTWAKDMDGDGIVDHAFPVLRCSQYFKKLAIPPVDPRSRFDIGQLDVGHGHRIMYAQYGDPKGPAILFNHGGPGGTSEETDLKYFPEGAQVILYDQRGCGGSTPCGAIDHNTFQDLLADKERLMDHLGIKTRVEFGGSFGSTLAVASAIKHPDRVTGVVGWGLFLASKKEIETAEALGYADWPKGPIEEHYYRNHFFINDRELIEGLPQLANKPVYMMSGKSDPLTPPALAIDLTEVLPKARTLIFEGVEHNGDDVQMTYALRLAARHLLFPRAIR